MNLEPFDTEGKPATRSGENIAMVLVSGVLKGRPAKITLDHLYAEGQVTEDQYNHFYSKGTHNE